MALINADSFKKFIESLPKNPNGTSRIYSKSDILHFIDAQPTAYDVEKVVAELESEVERWKESGIECKDKHDLAVSEGFKRALDIVKRGGVE